MAPFTEFPNVQRENIILVKPSEITPSDLLSLSSIDKDPNLEICCQYIHVYRANEGLSDNDDPTDLIKEALSKALAGFYPLAGKLKRNKDDGELQISCTGEGVPFMAADADCTLESLHYFDGIDVEVKNLFVLEVLGNEEDGTHPLTTQVTKFACGGFTIAMGIYHSVCDGYGVAQFNQAVAEFARGESECKVKPVWGRERLVGKATNNPIPLHIAEVSSYATSPFLPTTDIVHESFTFGADCLKRLKMSVESPMENFTTLEVLGAYVWRARFKALELNTDGKTNLAMTVGMRRILDPPLPQGYYGNAIVPTNIGLIGKDLIESPLSAVARVINDGKRNALNPEYISSMLDLFESGILPKVGANGASLILTDWRHLGLAEEIDPRWKVVNVVSVPCKMFGFIDLCFFLAPCKMNTSMKGGVTVIVSLPRAAMPKFKEEMDTLKLAFQM